MPAPLPLKGREGDCPPCRTAPNSSQGSSEAVPVRAVLGLPRPPSPRSHRWNQAGTKVPEGSHSLLH